MTYDEIAKALPRLAVTEILDLPYPRVGSGKVRELFDLGDALLLVATDRLSAFDVILPEGIPGKGILLTQMSRFWFSKTEAITENHLVAGHNDYLRNKLKLSEDMQLRSMVVKKLKPVPIECVVRGYLAGGGWSSYEKTGEVSGIRLPAGLQQAERLNSAIFTPTTKAPKGSHDEPINDGEGERIIGKNLYDQVKNMSIRLYEYGHARAAEAGMILADTKFEFGTDPGGKLYLIDEALTPDSSRYWPKEGYAVGISPPSFDKQFVRDYLLKANWDQKPPAPHLPAAVIQGTQERYLRAMRNLLT